MSVVAPANSVNAMSGNGTVCHSCDAAAPKVFCGACQNSHFCAACDAQIHKLKNKSHHQRYSLDGSSNGVSNKTFYCSTHQGKKSDLYCDDCKTLVCILCRDIDTHKGHSVRSAVEAAASLREAINESLAATAAVLKTREDLQARVERLAKDLRGLGKDQAKAHIGETIEQLSDAVNARKEHLLQEVDAAVAYRKNLLLDQKRSLLALVEYGEETCEKGSQLMEAPAENLAHGFKNCSTALDSITVHAPAQRAVACDTFVPFSADLQEVTTFAKDFGVVDGTSNILVDLSGADGSAVLRWNSNNLAAGWVPDYYAVRLSVVDVFGDINERRRPIGYERSVSDRVYPQSGACSIDINIRDLAGCKVLFSIQGTDGYRSTAWVSAGGAVMMPPFFIRKTFTSSGTAFDKQGLIYWIGTREGSSATFSNPVESGDLSIVLSSIGNGSSAASLCAAQEPVFGESVFTEIEAHACMLIDLGSSRRLRPTAYCLRHDTQGPRGALRNWVLQGSVEDTDEDEWVTLSVHENDTSLATEPGSTALFKLPALGHEGYRYYRIVQTGPNSSGKNRMMCSGVELYGDLY